MNSIYDSTYTEYSKTSSSSQATQHELSLTIFVDSYDEYRRILEGVKELIKPVAASSKNLDRQPMLPLKLANELAGAAPSESGKQVLAAVTAAIESAPPAAEPASVSEPVPQPATTTAADSNTEKAMEAITAVMEKVTKAPVPLSAPLSSSEDDTDSLTVQVFEMACSQVNTLEAAVQCWFDHAGAIKKLSDVAKRRCSTSLAMALSNATGVEPMEAQELIKAGVAKEQTRRKALLSPKESEVVQAASVTVQAPQGDAAAFLKRLESDPKPALGITVKYACEALAKNGEVTAASVEAFLVSLVGKHPTLDSVEAIQKITQTGKMKLYAGAAKVKLV